MNGPVTKLSSVVAAQTATRGLPVIYYKIVETDDGYKYGYKTKISLQHCRKGFVYPFQLD